MKLPLKELPDERAESLRKRRPAAMVVIVVLLFGAHLWGMTIGWQSYNLPGHEFRQSQTALSALFIQREGDFSLAYPTPVLGKPWSAPMEFPLYQWSAVALSNTSGLNLTHAGRIVSIASFYLMLPALFLVLGQLGIGTPSRLVVLACVLSCPLYIFYVRAFLIDPMALMWSMWFLFTFLGTQKNRKISWLVAANLIGLLAGLVKSTTFAMFLLPAVLWTAVALWQVLRQGGRERNLALLKTSMWAFAAVLIPVCGTFWWTAYADNIKSQNISAEFLMSSNTREFIFGTAAYRFSSEALNGHWKNLSQTMVNPWVLGISFLAFLGLGLRRWLLITFALVCFIVPVLVFPSLFVWHDYYSLATGVFILTAVGLALGCLWESPLSRWISGLLLITVFSLQWFSYWQLYQPMQNAKSIGGSGLTQAIRRVTNPDAVIVVAGFDWNSILPYFSERRALMIRSHMEHDWDYLTEAFANLKGEPVEIFVARGVQRENLQLLDMIVTHFDIDPRPVFTWGDSQVYAQKSKRFVVIEALRGWAKNDPGAAKLTPEAAKEDTSIIAREMRFEPLLFDDPEMFAMITPTPWKFYTQFGFRLAGYFGHPSLFSHPDTRLWFRMPAGRHRVRMKCTIEPGAYGPEVSPYDHTDGVDFVIYKEFEDGRKELMGSLFLDPSKHEEDRGIVSYELDVVTEDGTEILIATEPGPKGNAARDWGAFAEINIQTISPDLK